MFCLVTINISSWVTRNLLNGSLPFVYCIVYEMAVGTSQNRDGHLKIFSLIVVAEVRKSEEVLDLFNSRHDAANFRI